MDAYVSGHSNSQSLQDVFVLTIAGKRKGFFLEIGGFHSVDLSNTHLLENRFHWRGAIFEIVPAFAAELERNRKSQVFLGDAREVNWRRMVASGSVDKHPDYLQVDCEPALTSLQVLLSVLLSGIRPGIITFEHDAYSQASLVGLVPQGRFVRSMSRLFLRTLGYELIGPNIMTKSQKPYEDWWVRKDYSSARNPRPSQNAWKADELIELLGSRSEGPSLD